MQNRMYLGMYAFESSNWCAETSFNCKLYVPDASASIGSVQSIILYRINKWMNECDTSIYKMNNHLWICISYIVYAIDRYVFQHGMVQIDTLPLEKTETNEIIKQDPHLCVTNEKFTKYLYTVQNWI